MQDRWKELSEGAGRTESRIDQDFTDFLSKWSTPFLVLLAVLAVGYWGLNRYKAMKLAEANEATAAYAMAIGGETVLPVRLEEIARKYEGIGSIAHLARLDAADLHLEAVQRGLAPGVAFNPQAGVDALGVGDILDDAHIKTHLDEAERLYKSVLDATRNKQGHAQIAVGAAFGLAAVAESRGDLEAAKGYLAEAEKLAKAGELGRLAAAAAERAGALTAAPERALVVAGTLPPLPEITPPPAPDAPATTPPLDNPPLVPAADGAAPAEDGAPPADDGAASPDDAAPAPAPDDDGTGG